MSKRTRVCGRNTGIVAHLTYDHHRAGGEDVALCGVRVLSPHEVTPITVATLCTECVRLDDEPPSSPQRKVPDPNPSIGIQHRCSRMGEHVTGSWRGSGRPGSDPADLPVPCDDCYSIVVTSVAIPWQPNVPSRSIP